MTRERVAGVVLAAGMSTRMGRNKMLLEAGGQPLVRRAVTTALAGGLDPVLAVLGHESEAVEAALAGLPCIPLINRDYARGMNTSVRAAFIALPEDVGAGVVLLGDMPLVTSAMIRALTSAFRQQNSPLVLSKYGDVVAPPILYGRALFSQLRTLEADACGKSVVKAHRAEAVELRWPEEALTDLDRPEDLERVRARLEAA
jgi:molybdenum cofactor cytidylyltransferase